MNDRGRFRAVVAAAVVAGLAGMAGCSAGSVDKSGGDPEPMQLVLANNNGGGLAEVRGVAHFVDTLQRLSNGRVTVEVESEWSGGAEESLVVTDVGAGKADLGWAGTRVFDTLGVDAFRPLHAPFLVSSYAAEAAVVQSQPVQELVHGLQPLGLDGLALLSDQLRMPAGAGGPLLTREDFEGKNMGTWTSKIQAEGLRALGAEATFDQDAADAVETSWSTYQGRSQYGAKPYITHNVALWPRSVVIFGNTEKLADLDAETRGWITEAAAEAVTWSASHAGEEVTGQIAEVCKFGARIATATPAQLRDLRKAVEPVYAALRSDPAQAQTLAHIEKVVNDTTPSPLPGVPTGCAYRPGEESNVARPVERLDGPGRAGALPEKAYRYELNRDALLEAGLTDNDANLNAGIYTWAFRSGKWKSRFDPAVVQDNDFPSTCEGFYSVAGSTVSFTTTTTFEGGDCAPPTWAATFSVNGRTLRWGNVTIPDFAIVWSTPTWEQID